MVVLILKRFSSQVSSNTPHNFNKDRVSNNTPQGGDDCGFSLSAYASCGRKHEGKYLAGTYGSSSS